MNRAASRPFRANSVRFGTDRKESGRVTVRLQPSRRGDCCGQRQHDGAEHKHHADLGCTLGAARRGADLLNVGLLNRLTCRWSSCRFIIGPEWRRGGIAHIHLVTAAAAIDVMAQAGGRRRAGHGGARCALLFVGGACGCHSPITRSRRERSACGPKTIAAPSGFTRMAARPAPAADACGRRSATNLPNAAPSAC